MDREFEFKDVSFSVRNFRDVCKLPGTEDFIRFKKVNSNCKFIDCDFFGNTNALFDGKLNNITFENCEFYDVEFNTIECNNMTLIDCSFKNCLFEIVEINNSYIKNCYIDKFSEIIEDASLGGLFIMNSIVKNTDFRIVDKSALTLDDTEIIKVDDIFF